MFAGPMRGFMMKRAIKVSATAAGVAAFVSMGVIAAAAGTHENDASSSEDNADDDDRHDKKD